MNGVGCPCHVCETRKRQKKKSGERTENRKSRKNYYEKTTMKTIKLGLKKYVKGMFGILMIKLCFAVMILINQACESEEFVPQDTAKESFLEALKASRSRMGQIQTIKDLASAGIESDGIQLVEGVIDNTNGMTTICTKDKLHDDSNYGNDGMIPLTLNEFTTVYLTPKSEYPGDDMDNCYTFDNDEVQEALDPAIVEARQFLHTRGMTDEDIDQMIVEEGGTEEDLIATVTLVIEDERSRGYASSANFSSIFVNSAYAQDWDKIGNCAAKAIGIDAAYAITSGTSGGKWKKKAIAKLFKKVASRFLGPVGVALAVMEFAFCVGTE